MIAADFTSAQTSPNYSAIADPNEALYGLIYQNTNSETADTESRLYRTGKVRHDHSQCTAETRFG